MVVMDINIRKFFTQKIEFSYKLLTYLIALVVVINVVITGENEFSVLSEQFIRGHIFLPEAVGDAVLYNGKYFWHLGPLPAMLLTPLSLITLPVLGFPMPQGILNIILVIGIVYLSYKISLKYNFDKKSGVWMAIAVVFASVFFLSTLLPWSWHFSQTITFFLGLLALYNYTGSRNYLLIGVCHALMFMTRFTAGLGILFYFLATIFSKTPLREKLRRCLLMVLPIVLAGVVLLWYNYARFENVFDNGYTTSNNWVPSSNTFRYEMLKYGLFNVKNIPTNVYYYFFNVPSPVLETSQGYYRQIFKTDTSMIVHLVFPYIKVTTPGVSFFVVSPIFLLIFRNKFKSKDSKIAAVTGGVILILLLMYYWTGWTQVGPRYTIDLLPFLFILLIESFREKKVTLWQKFVISFSSLFNIYLFLSLVS